MQVYTSFIK